MIYLIRVSAIVVVLVSVFPNIAAAQFGAGWMKTPQIVVIGPTDDPRQPLVVEAVAFWNKTLEELGSGFRLGTITRHAGSVSGDELMRMSNQVVEPTRRHNFALPNAIINIPGGLFMVRGFAAAYQFMNDAKNHDEVRNIVKESLKISDDTARQFFAPLNTQTDKNVLPRRGELDLKAFDRVLALMGEAGVIPTPVAAAERFVDLQFLKSAGIQ